MSNNMSRRDFLRLSAIVALETALFPLAASRPAMAATPAAGATALSPSPSSPEVELAYLAVDEQIRRFKAGTLSPVDVLEAQIARIKELNGPLNISNDEPRDFMNFNGKINAVAYEHFDQARKAAKESEARYKAGTARALEGITVAVKDENDVEGWRVSMGSLPLKDAPLCEENTAIIDKLLEAGAVLHIQTTVPELYVHIQTWSRLWGVTRNPWNLHYAVGGSSGGSGAALAAGFATLATGSDMGGSIRIPSSQCGVYGFRPPFGRVATSEISFETLGPMARTFDDLVRMQNVVCGPHPKSHASIRPKLEYPTEYESLKGVKIALDYFGGWIDAGVDDTVRKSLSDAADALRSQGAIVDEIDLGWKKDLIYETFAKGLMSTAMGEMLLTAREFKDKMTTYASKFLDVMSATGPAEMARSDELTTMLHRQLQEEVYGKGYAALIMPTLLTPYLPATNDPTKDMVYINGKTVPGMDFVVTYPWNLLSRYPVVDVPVGVADNNVPIGMQVIGNTFDDLAAFRVAYGYSRAGLRLYQGEAFPDGRNVVVH